MEEVVKIIHYMRISADENKPIEYYTEIETEEENICYYSREAQEYFEGKGSR